MGPVDALNSQPDDENALFDVTASRADTHMFAAAAAIVLNTVARHSFTQKETTSTLVFESAGEGACVARMGVRVKPGEGGEIFQVF